MEKRNTLSYNSIDNFTTRAGFMEHIKHTGGKVDAMHAAPGIPTEG